MTRYLTLDDAVQAIDRMGLHVRDAGLLSSALARPASSFGGTEVYPSMDEKAAAMLESLARNHPLFDGNKRTAWVLTQLFLWLNGWRHTFTTDEAFELVLSVAQGESPVSEVADAIATHRERRAAR